MTASFHTFGCKANQYDTERMRQEAEAREAATTGPEVVRRQPVPADAVPAAFSEQVQAFQPSSFLELLDASLKL